jgi:hypothetical protein
MYAIVIALITLLATQLLVSTAVANGDPPSSAKCRQEIRAIDDQTDIDVRDINRLIALLEDEVNDRAIASGGQDLQDRLRARLGAAKLHRSSILDKQHNDLNAIRARCDRLRDEAKRATDASETSQEHSMKPSPAQEPKREAELELADEHGIRYWSTRFRCTPTELLAVVARIGRSVSLVQAEVARRASIRQASNAPP